MKFFNFQKKMKNKFWMNINFNNLFYKYSINSKIAFLTLKLINICENSSFKSGKD